MKCIVAHTTTDVNKQNSELNSALHEAAFKGNKDMVDRLISAGANVNMQNSAGKAPLHRAVSVNHLSVVKTLLDNGALVNLQDSRMCHSHSHSFSSFSSNIHCSGIHALPLCRILWTAWVCWDVSGSRSWYSTQGQDQQQDVLRTRPRASPLCGGGVPKQGGECDHPPVIFSLCGPVIAWRGGRGFVNYYVVNYPSPNCTWYS